MMPVILEETDMEFKKMKYIRGKKWAEIAQVDLFIKCTTKTKQNISWNIPNIIEMNIFYSYV